MVPRYCLECRRARVLRRSKTHGVRKFVDLCSTVRDPRRRVLHAISQYQERLDVECGPGTVQHTPTIDDPGTYRCSAAGCEARSGQNAFGVQAACVERI